MILHYTTQFRKDYKKVKKKNDLNSNVMIIIAMLLFVIVVLLLVLINKTPSGPDCYSTSDGRGTICDYPDGSRRILYK